VQIVYLAAGAAGMYCGSCLHDNTLAAALLRRGEEVLLVPIYTPLRTDEANVSLPRVFFGGINAYLQQRFALFRHTPAWLDAWLDRPWLLNLVTRRASSVDPARLGPMTVSMLSGESGNQRKELAKLVAWICGEVRPDVVHLSNSMMLGLARQIQDQAGPPIVCALSGEDLFLEQLVEPYYSQARQLLRERASEIPAFTALNDFYAERMADYLSVPRARVQVIPHGLDLDTYDAPTRPDRQPSGQPLRIGFLARICHEKGLHLLVEAGEQLARREDLPPFEIRAAGYLGAGTSYLKDLQRRAESGPLAGKFHYDGEPDLAGKRQFLASLDLLSTPTVYRESKGLPVLEAWASGVPVVVPRHGAFPEMIAASGGGLLHEAEDPADLARCLAVLLQDPQQRNALGTAGKQAIRTRYHSAAMADQTLALYRRVVEQSRGIGGKPHPG
jgi:glycosyltransferase involved in cell wall biosynthesis